MQTKTFSFADPQNKTRPYDLQNKKIEISWHVEANLNKYLSRLCRFCNNLESIYFGNELNCSELAKTPHKRFKATCTAHNAAQFHDFLTMLMSLIITIHSDTKKSLGKCLIDISSIDNQIYFTVSVAHIELLSDLSSLLIDDESVSAAYLTKSISQLRDKDFIELQRLDNEINALIDPNCVWKIFHPDDL